MPTQHPVTDEALAALVRAAVIRSGVPAVRRSLNIEPEVILRVAGSIPGTRRGTWLFLREKLDVLRELAGESTEGGAQ